MTLHLVDPDGRPVAGADLPNKIVVMYDRSSGRFTLQLAAEGADIALYMLARAAHRLNVSLDGADAARLKG